MDIKLKNHKILKLGLLQRVDDNDTANLRASPELFRFSQKVFQDFVVGIFVSRKSEVRVIVNVSEDS